MAGDGPAALAGHRHRVARRTGSPPAIARGRGPPPGAVGVTRAELTAALGDGAATGLVAAEVGPDVTIGFGSCLWSPPTLHFARPFAQLAIQDHAAVTMTTGVRAAPAAINAWAKRLT